MNYVIKTPGRTGSHRILDYLIKKQNCRPVWNLLTGLTEPIDPTIYPNFVVHDRQNNFTPVDTKQWTCIISLRQNKFEQILSYLTAVNTQEFVFYSEKEISITPSIDEFQSVFDRILQEENRIIMSIKDKQWASLDTVYFEDICDDLLDSKFSYNDRSICDFWDKTVSEKSPREKTQVFENYQKLKDYYEHMISNK